MRLLVIQNIECEPLGLFGELVPARVDIDCRRAHRGDSLPGSLSGHDAAVILGGPMGANETGRYGFLGDELALIETIIENDQPLLGVCLGSQLIARAAGARVYAGPSMEIGWSRVRLTGAAADDTLFCGLDGEVPVFQWHGDTFDLPPDAVLLAAGDMFRNQAFRVGRNVYGLQFHVEVTAAMAREWALIYEKDLEKSGISRSGLMDESRDAAAGMQPVARQLFTRFIGLASADERPAAGLEGTPGSGSSPCP